MIYGEISFPPRISFQRLFLESSYKMLPLEWRDGECFNMTWSPNIRKFIKKGLWPFFETERVSVWTGNLKLDNFHNNAQTIVFNNRQRVAYHECVFFIIAT